ncbi:hypothetical protein DSO57_1038744 [Entomophthora muscae]|uniref:Uncharacterized protein n=1 Tax=Entomophthora muscae TaxID=34485 RepID=A0ACC2RPL2_9FUNG|nr:hypothetical protein DSO57_1038744 [Entomophthora muscae]
MIQDTSFGQEVYISRYANGHEWKFNAYRDHNPDELSSETEQEQGANFIVERTSMEDRDLWYAVSTPGLSGWTGQAQVSGENQGIRTENPKYPLAGQPHIGVVLKFYGLDPNHPPAGVADLVDIIGVAGTCYSSQDHVIHVLALRKLTDWGADPLHPWINQEVSQSSGLLFQECLLALRGVLGGDERAAEYLLLQILSRSSERAPDACRYNVLNLIFPEGFDTKPLVLALENLLPILSVYNMTISSLNVDHLMPRFVDDDSAGLLAGRLQLPSATFLVIDETNMDEGQLNDCGVKNIQAIAELASNSRLPYIYPYFQTSLASNMSILALSTKSRALVPSQICFQVSPTFPASAASQIDWAGLRTYIRAVSRPRTYTIPQDMADIIQNNFVEQRQHAWAQTPESSTPTFTHQDLERQLLLARLIALSLDPLSSTVVLSPVPWERAVLLHNASLEAKGVTPGITEANLSKSLGKLRIDSPPPLPLNAPIDCFYCTSINSMYTDDYRLLLFSLTVHENP